MIFTMTNGGPMNMTTTWQTWVTKSCTVSGATGTHNVYQKFTGSSGYLFNISIGSSLLNNESNGSLEVSRS